MVDKIEMDIKDTYKTIKGRCEGLFKDKGSKFIAIASPVNDEDEVRDRLSDVKSEYHDARHHCYAYMLGFNQNEFRMNDDGEPSGTAGRPILGQIRSHELTNVLIVVVRYFGGTKLGVRGLINAYKAASADALTNGIIETRIIHDIFNVKFKYPEMNQVMKMVKDEQIQIFDQQFEMDCEMKLAIRKKDVDRVQNRLIKINNLVVKYLRTE